MHVLNRLTLLVVLLTALLFANPGVTAWGSPTLTGTSQSSSGHEDSTFGYKIKPPKGWVSIPLKVDEGWLIAKYLSKREYHFNEKGGWTYAHKPELMAIAFIHPNSDEEEAEEEGDQDDGVEVIHAFSDKYEDYKDYLKKTYREGGYTIAAEKEVENNEVKITALDIKVSKASITGPKRIRTWIYHLDGVDIAIQIEVLENHYDKLKKTVETTLKSFKEIPREGPLPSKQKSADGFITSSGSKAATLSLPERNKLLMEQCEAQHQKVIESLPEGWKHSVEKSCLVITNADLKDARKIAQQVTAILDWLEGNLDYFGPQHYVREPILRVCKTRDEQQAYNRGGGDGWGGTSLEFVTSIERHRDWFGGFDWLSGRVAAHWFQDRDRELYWAMPEWLQHGFEELFDNSKLKGSKLKFHKDDWDRDDLRQAVRDDRVRGPSNLMMMCREDLWDSDSSGRWTARDESASLVFFLIAGDGAKKKKYKQIIPDYITNLKLVLEERKAKAGGVNGDDEGSEAATDLDKEELHRKLREDLRNQEKELLQEVYNRTFADWTEKDWEKLDKAFLKSIS